MLTFATLLQSPVSWRWPCPKMPRSRKKQRSACRNAWASSYHSSPVKVRSWTRSWAILTLRLMPSVPIRNSFREMSARETQNCQRRGYPLCYDVSRFWELCRSPKDLSHEISWGKYILAPPQCYPNVEVLLLSPWSGRMVIWTMQLTGLRHNPQGGSTGTNNQAAATTRVAQSVVLSAHPKIIAADHRRRQQHQSSLLVLRVPTTS